MKKYFVKFVPWNEKTLSSLINKTIKFSTVFEFNDFNEYRYIGTASMSPQDKEQGVINILTQEIYKLDFTNNLLKLAKERCSPEYYKKIIGFLKSGKNKKLLDKDEGCLNLLAENLAYSNVGMFCLSGIKVFEDDAAQLMFAHYSQNLEGLALVYELDSSVIIHPILYDSSIKISSGQPARIINWYKGIYDDMEDYRYKTKKWKYENESRIFFKPGIQSMIERGVKVRAILYTRRFKGDESTLANLNKTVYNDSLAVEKIYASSSEFYLLMGKDGAKVSQFLKNLLSS